MRPDPFFSGEGLDRADHLRADGAAIEELRRRPDALQLAWNNGAPAVDERGMLLWQAVREVTPLFLGLDSGAPRFSSLPDGNASVDARVHFQLLSLLCADQAPTFAAAFALNFDALNRVAHLVRPSGMENLAGQDRSTKRNDTGKENPAGDGIVAINHETPCGLAEDGWIWCSPLRGTVPYFKPSTHASSKVRAMAERGGA